MTFLIDTHLLLWAASTPGRLSLEARRIFVDRGNTLVFSAVSIWEVGVKSALGRVDFQVDPRLFRRGLLANGYVELAVTGEHAVELAHLPDVHGDPFDRMLICQARVEGYCLLTVDKDIARYGAPVRLV